MNNVLTNENRKAIKEVREEIRYMVQVYGFLSKQDADFAYNLAVKAYLRGMYAATKNALEEVEAQENNTLQED